ncbi:J domain-containing protein [Salinirubellus salinus]|uniref:J domain-containing protein n=1 Tax=Salinirubellus salinus TaxID=1364945 RepID=A0A9E7R3M5_9EURY|nr:J domain-containing protein [Salinirubellus salinus]UWM55191.1 J domain-containing protein [Salinirubellus salinus]
MSELDWPEGFERTPDGDRRSYPHGFRVDMRRAFRNIKTQLERMDVDDFRVESGTDHLQDRPWLPYKNAPNQPADPGVVVRWTVDGESFAAPCDRWNNVRDNAQAIAKYLDAKRALDRYGVSTISSEFATQALPSGEDALEAEPPAHIVLGVDPDAGEREVIEAFRERAKETHADTGGSSEEFKRVKRARERMLEGDR